MCRNCEPILGSQKVKVFWSRAYIKHGLDQTYVFHFAVLLLLKLIPDPALVPGGWMWIQLWYGKTETPWSLQSAFLQCVLHVASPPSYSLSSVKGLWSCLQFQSWIHFWYKKQKTHSSGLPLHMFIDHVVCAGWFVFLNSETDVHYFFCVVTDLLMLDPASCQAGGCRDVATHKPPCTNGLLLLAVARIASTARCDKPM